MVYNTARNAMLPHHKCCNLSAISASGKGKNFLESFPEPEQKSY